MGEWANMYFCLDACVENVYKRQRIGKLVEVGLTEVWKFSNKALGSFTDYAHGIGSLLSEVSRKGCVSINENIFGTMRCFPYGNAFFCLETWSYG